ncbi:hypothetical protein ADUPG1_011959, partial [Aduncisulcus paluster]
DQDYADLVSQILYAIVTPDPYTRVVRIEDEFWPIVQVCFAAVVRYDNTPQRFPTTLSLVSCFFRSGDKYVEVLASRIRKRLDAWMRCVERVSDVEVNQHWSWFLSGFADDHSHRFLYWLRAHRDHIDWLADHGGDEEEIEVIRKAICKK